MHLLKKVVSNKAEFLKKKSVCNGLATLIRPSETRANNVWVLQLFYYSALRYLYLLHTGNFLHGSRSCLCSVCSGCSASKAWKQQEGVKMIGR